MTNGRPPYDDEEPTRDVGADDAIPELNDGYDDDASGYETGELTAATLDVVEPVDDYDDITGEAELPTLAADDSLPTHVPKRSRGKHADMQERTDEIDLGSKTDEVNLPEMTIVVDRGGAVDQTIAVGGAVAAAEAASEPAPASGGGGGGRLAVPPGPPHKPGAHGAVVWGPKSWGDEGPAPAGGAARPAAKKKKAAPSGPKWTPHPISADGAPLPFRALPPMKQARIGPAPVPLSAIGCALAISALPPPVQARIGPAPVPLSAVGAVLPIAALPHPVSDALDTKGGKAKKGKAKAAPAAVVQPAGPRLAVPPGPPHAPGAHGEIVWGPKSWGDDAGGGAAVAVSSGPRLVVPPGPPHKPGAKGPIVWGPKSWDKPAAGGAPGAPTAPGAPKAPGAPGAPKMPGAPGGAKAKPKKKEFAKDSPEYLLSKVELFAGLSDKLISMVVEESEFRVVSPKTQICREGDYSDDFYVILAGLVGIYKSQDDAGTGQKYLGSLREGTWIGEMSCMSNAPRSASITAEAESVVLSVPRHAFMKVYSDRGAKAFKDKIDELYRDRAMTIHLASVSLFRGVNEKVLKRIGSVADLIVIEKGQRIVKEGDQGDAFYLIRTGHAKVTQRIGKKEEILAWLCENSFFGEVALIRDAPRSSTVTAVDRMDLVRIPKDPFLKLLEKNADAKSMILGRIEQLFEEEFLSEEEAAARTRAREIGTEHEVVKAGDALVIDMSKCTRCNMCVTGCIEAHDDRIPRIGKRGIGYGDLLLTSSCYNCKVPDCMLACKFGAIRRDRKGQVNIDNEACTGCSQCEPACPYGTIHMQSLLGEDGIDVMANANPFTRLLSTIPVFGKVFKPKPKTEEPKEREKGAPKALAVKCDLCAGRADMACIYNCPCGAIERIDPDILLGTEA